MKILLDFLDVILSAVDLLFETADSALAATGISIGTCVTGALAYRYYQQNKDAQIQRVRTIQSIIFENLQNVREMVTVRKTINPVMTISEKGFLPFSSRNLTISCTGRLVCSCDLNLIRVVPDGISGVKILVPHSRLVDSHFEMETLKIHTQEVGLFASKFKLEEQNQLLTENLESAKRDAIQQGILLQADENVRSTLAAFISRRGLEAEIVFVDGQPDLLN